MAAQWNPPPPDPVSSQPRAHQEAAEDDSIGDTVFSKAWVLSVLVEAVERVQRKKEEGRELEEFNTKGGMALGSLLRAYHQRLRTVCVEG